VAVVVQQVKQHQVLERLARQVLTAVQAQQTQVQAVTVGKASEVRLAVQAVRALLFCVTLTNFR
jgi:hypothetical protein